MKKPATLSISFRLRRTTVEETFVSVPVSKAIMDSAPDEEGNFHIDPHAAAMQAILMGLNDNSSWTMEEEPRVELHPVQIAPPTVC